MFERRRVAVVAVLAGALLWSGCSMLFMRRPPKGEGPVALGDCTRSLAAPIIDSVVGLVNVGVAAGIWGDSRDAFDSDKDYDEYRFYTGLSSGMYVRLRDPRFQVERRLSEPQHAQRAGDPRPSPRPGGAATTKRPLKRTLVSALFIALATAPLAGQVTVGLRGGIGTATLSRDMPRVNRAKEGDPDSASYLGSTWGFLWVAPWICASAWGWPRRAAARTRRHRSPRAGRSVDATAELDYLKLSALLRASADAEGGFLNVGVLAGPYMAVNLSCSIALTTLFSPPGSGSIGPSAGGRPGERKRHATTTMAPTSGPPTSGWPSGRGRSMAG